MDTSSFTVVAGESECTSCSVPSVARTICGKNVAEVVDRHVGRYLRILTTSKILVPCNVNLLNNNAVDSNYAVLASILVGGALTGVIVGIGAQSLYQISLRAWFCFTLRPFTIGQTITVRTYLFSGVEYSGVVQGINWYHTIILSKGQKRVIPNSSIIVSAITVISDEHMTVFVVPLPYSISVHQFENSLQQNAAGKARVVVRAFGENVYNCEVRLPFHTDTDVIRSILNEYH